MASRKDAAKQLGVEPQTLYEWWKKPATWFPLDAVRLDSRGRAFDWDVARIASARQTAKSKQSDETAAATQKLNLAEKAEKLKQLQLKTKQIQREDALAEGNILARDEWTLFAAESINVARDQLKDVPKQLARLIDGDELQRKMIDEGTRLIAGILDRLADTLEEGPAD